MNATARVIADSVNPAGQRLTTVQVRYWRAVHAELMTHRAFSRNASSSRAIPVRKMLAQVWGDPAGPLRWGANQSGMQAEQELTGWRLSAAFRPSRLSLRSSTRVDKSLVLFSFVYAPLATSWPGSTPSRGRTATTEGSRRSIRSKPSSRMRER